MPMLSAASVSLSDKHRYEAIPVNLSSLGQYSTLIFILHNSEINSFQWFTWQLLMDQNLTSLIMKLACVYENFPPVVVWNVTEFQRGRNWQHTYLKDNIISGDMLRNLMKLCQVWPTWSHALISYGVKSQGEWSSLPRPIEPFLHCSLCLSAHKLLRLIGARCKCLLLSNIISNFIYISLFSIFLILLSSLYNLFSDLSLHSLNYFSLFFLGSVNFSSLHLRMGSIFLPLLIPLALAKHWKGLSSAFLFFSFFFFLIKYQGL